MECYFNKVQLIVQQHTQLFNTEQQIIIHTTFKIHNQSQFRKNLRSQITKADDEATQFIKEKLIEGDTPQQILQSKIQYDQIRKHAKTITEENHLMKLISETFGEYTTKQNQTFNTMFRQMKKYQVDVDQLREKMNKIKTTQSDLLFFFQQCFADMDQYIQQTNQLEIQQNINVSEITKLVDQYQKQNSQLQQ